MTWRFQIAALSLLPLCAIPSATLGDVEQAVLESCGVDNMGWDLGEITFERLIDLPNGTKIHIHGIYVGRSTHLVIQETTSDTRAIPERGSSHLTTVPPKPGTPSCGPIRASTEHRQTRTPADDSE